MTSPSPASSVFDLASEFVEPALRVTVKTRMHPDLARIASYHAGWTSQTGEETTGRGGKMLRPTLAVLSALSAGGTAASAQSGAIAVELLHAFSLLHDDVIDEDRTRRGRPTAWVAYGTGPALLAGDALMALALETVAATGVRAAIDELLAAHVALVWGQAEDLRFERVPTVSVAEYTTMIGAKTGALIECSCAIGATILQASQHCVTGLRQIGFHLGQAFQIADDILGIWGDPALTGKPVHSDLARRKKTLPILAALSSDTAAGSELASLLNTEDDLDPDTLSDCAQLIEQAGGRTRAEQAIQTHHRKALDTLHVLRLPEPATQAWQELLSTLAVRDH